MNNIYKICLFIAIFLASGSLAWAGFNYDSSNNYFLLDAILKVGGNYVLVGDALAGYCSNSAYISQSQCEANGQIWYEQLKNEAGTGSGQFFAISNNLIFPATGKFDAGTNRQMDRDNFTTSAITVEGISNFKIDVARQGILTMDAGQIDMNGLNFIISREGAAGGLSVASEFDPDNNTIKAWKLLTNKIQVFPFVNGKSPALDITDNAILELMPGGSASADKIITSDNIDVCKKVSLYQTGLHHYDEKHTLEEHNSRLNGDATPCESGYWVFDLDADSTDGSYSMICCRPDNINI